MMQFFMLYLIFIYYMIGMLICKYKPLWQEVSVGSLISNYSGELKGLWASYKMEASSKFFLKEPLMLSKKMQW